MPGQHLHRSPDERILNIAAYKFVSLTPEFIRSWRPVLRSYCRAYGLKGTVLLSTEGINLFLAGEDDNLHALLAYIRSHEPFADLQWKESFSSSIPFTRILVKLKKEIIPMGHNINPTEFTAPRVTPAELKQWLDTRNDIVMLDTRNTYEYERGTFANAMTMDIEHFRTFPAFVEQLDESLKDKTIVTFCTGGIRCEKAGAYMVEKGFTNVYQLDGGILKYFEDVGEAHYDGNCFVFDGRGSLDPALHAEFFANSSRGVDGSNEEE
ncbi:MAG: sulfurtransferase [Candidatus Kapabacteria bacterium]|nr:sulfurtransferase [Candidatus Kapabacteria bacterium]